VPARRRVQTREHDGVVAGYGEAEGDRWSTSHPDPFVPIINIHERGTGNGR